MAHPFYIVKVVEKTYRLDESHKKAGIIKSITDSIYNRNESIKDQGDLK